jgi:hypothetical protein
VAEIEPVPQHTHRAAGAFALLVLAGLIACGGVVAKASGRRVEPDGQRAKPHVIVVQRGWSQRTFSPGSSAYSYGIVLANTSGLLDALRVDVRVEPLDAAGSPLDTQRVRVTGIPAGGTFVVAGASGIRGSERIARLRVWISVGADTQKELRLPPVSTVRVEPTQGGLFNVVGTLENPYHGVLSAGNLIGYVVLLTRNGTILGGEERPAVDRATYPANTIAPGGQAPFLFQPSDVIVVGRVASAWVSIDPLSIPH